MCLDDQGYPPDLPLLAMKRTYPRHHQTKEGKRLRVQSWTWPAARGQALLSPVNRVPDLGINTCCFKPLGCWRAYYTALFLQWLVKWDALLQATHFLYLSHFLSTSPPGCKILESRDHVSTFPAVFPNKQLNTKLLNGWILCNQPQPLRLYPQ